MITVIIPVFNSEKYIEKCVNSVLNQSYTNLEVILINDGSIDQSLSLIQKMAKRDSRIKIINKKNGGVSSARNVGILNAKGEYIIFIDSDDYIGKNFISEYIRLLKFRPNALVYQSFNSEYRNKIVEELLPAQIFSKDNISEALIILEEKRCLGGACNKVFRKDIIIKNGILFNENFSYGEDKIFTLNYMQYVDDFIFSKNADYYYNRKEINTLSKKYHQSKELLEFVNMEFDGFQKLLKKYPSKVLEEIVNARYSSFLKYVLLSMYRKSDYADKRDRMTLAKKISTFDKKKKRNKKFEIEVPNIINYTYKSDLLMRFLMVSKNQFQGLYQKIYRSRING